MREKKKKIFSFQGYSHASIAVLPLSFYIKQNV